MSDDLVKRLRTPWDVDRSIISQTDKWMMERQEAADRIEELEEELAKVVEALKFYRSAINLRIDCEITYAMQEAHDNAEIILASWEQTNDH